jgi:hypothetical protein
VAVAVAVAVAVVMAVVMGAVMAAVVENKYVMQLNVGDWILRSKGRSLIAFYYAYLAT